MLGVQAVWGGVARAMALVHPHSEPVFLSSGPGSWPWGFLVSALPTEPVQGTLADELPPPLPEGALMVGSYGPVVLAVAAKPAPAKDREPNRTVAPTRAARRKV